MRRQKLVSQNQEIVEDSPSAASFLLSVKIALRFIANSVRSTALDWVFPAQCSGCGRVDRLFCEQCIAAITTVAQHNPVVGLDQFVSVGDHQGPLRKAIHDLKYNHRPQLHYPLGQLLAATILKQTWTFDLIIPVPLHSTRNIQRGYNQAKILATVVANDLEYQTLPHILQRTRHTMPQVGKSSQERLSNVQGAFAIPTEYTPLIRDRHILLIDDVCTTGATLAACADALRDAGAGKILGATLSRARYIDRTSGS